MPQAAEVATALAAVNWAVPLHDTDVRLVVGAALNEPSAVFHAHRAVLMKRSDYFAALFHSGMKDAAATEQVLDRTFVRFAPATPS